MPMLEDMSKREQDRIRSERISYLADPPVSGHRYNSDNVGSFDSDNYVEFCPNGDGTMVLPDGQISKMGDAYEEITGCSDCNCVVTRRPSDERIADFESGVKSRHARVFGD